MSCFEPPLTPIRICGVYAIHVPGEASLFFCIFSDYTLFYTESATCYLLNLLLMSLECSFSNLMKIYHAAGPMAWHLPPVFFRMPYKGAPQHKSISFRDSCRGHGAGGGRNSTSDTRNQMHTEPHEQRHGKKKKERWLWWGSRGVDGEGS